MSKPFSTQTTQGEALEIRPLDVPLETRRKLTLVKTNNMELVQLVIPEGDCIPTHEAQGEIILHCLEGIVIVTALSEVHELTAGHLLYLRINEPFSIRGVKHASLLATIIVPKQGSNVPLIGA